MLATSLFCAMLATQGCDCKETQHGLYDGLEAVAIEIIGVSDNLAEVIQKKFEKRGLALSNVISPTRGLFGVRVDCAPDGPCIVIATLWRVAYVGWPRARARPVVLWHRVSMVDQASVRSSILKSADEWLKDYTASTKRPAA